ncbi:uncharacterized protein LOC120615023 [Pteropus medius]|uniref:uncharacterized protein LOC120615023 n=1 Tax=Pteropus vampyrus TaxID=132908 RepID=UPI00196AE744|nr:uncharacterized protein LOC120615023 [Pteropus giganteus]
MERPPRGRAQPWCCRETPPAESRRSKPIPPLPSPKRSPLYRHRDDYIFSARARLSPQSFHLKEEKGGQESAIRHPRLLPRGSYRLPSSSFSKPLSLPSARSCPLPGRLILPGSWEKAKLLFPLQGWSGLRAERLKGPLGDERTARCGRQWNRRGRAEQPRVCRERGGRGKGRRRARQCHGLIFIPISLCCAATLPVSPGLDAQGEGLRGAEGRSGVAHKLLWKDCESTRVGPQNVGGGSEDPVTRCWSVGEGVVRHLFGNCFLSFYFQFFYAETFKNYLQTQMVFWGSKESRLETEFFLRLRGPPWWKPIRTQETSNHGRRGLGWTFATLAACPEFSGHFGITCPARAGPLAFFQELKKQMARPPRCADGGDCSVYGAPRTHSIQNAP